MNRKNAILIFILIIISTYSYLFPQKSPDDFFGLQVGADRTLVKYPDIARYFTYLDAESTRIKLVDEGQSTRGNPMILAFISSEENINRLQELIDINKKLANPDTIDNNEAHQLIKKAKVFVLITCAIHATEIASTQMSMLFAHKLAATRDPSLMDYLDRAVIMLMPSINPDGNIMVTEWYNKYVNTEYEGCRLPYLYHHYAGHDTNRDFYMLNLDETRIVNAVLHHKYFPHIFLDMHQMGSTGVRMFAPPFYHPLNPNLNPLMLRETDIIGTFITLKLQENEKKGVATSYGFDAYWPGGSKNTAWYKNVVGVLTELASVQVASPVYIEPNELQVSSKGLPEYKAQVNFPDPWTGGWWRLKDIVDYEMIAVEALLEVAAKHRETFLANFYQVGLSSIEKGKSEPPYGYVIPINSREQWDIPAAYTLLKKMAENGVRIYTLEADARSGNRIYPKGSFFIPMSQPYRSFIKAMMECQHYPEIKYMSNGPVIEPYDASGWTLPLQMGVKSMEINTPPEGITLTPVKNPDYPEASITGEGDYYCIPARFNRSAMVVNRLLKKGTAVFRYIGAAKGPSHVHADPYAGDFLVNVSGIDSEAMTELLTGTGVGIRKVTAAKPDLIKKISLPRTGIYQSYRASMDEGWTRWVLDRFEFSYRVLHNNDFDLKNLTKNYDLIIFPDMGRDTIVSGAFRPSRFYIPQDSTPPEYRGGIREKGVEALKKFVQQGGTIVLLDSAAGLGIKDFSLPFSNILEKVKEDKFFCPGSILKIRVDYTDPLGWGLEENSIIYFSNSMAFRTGVPLLKSIDRKVAAGFNQTGPHLLSGYLKGGEFLDRAVTAVRFNYYKGNVIVLGGRVQHRGQTFGTFKFLFNSLYYAGMAK